MATDLPSPPTSRSFPPSLRPLTSLQLLQDPSPAPKSEAGILPFPGLSIVGPKLAKKSPGEGGLLPLSFRVIPMPHSLWNFIMLRGSSEVWQLRTDLARRRQGQTVTCPHVTETSNVSTESKESA